MYIFNGCFGNILKTLVTIWQSQDFHAPSLSKLAVIIRTKKGLHIAASSWRVVIYRRQDLHTTSCWRYKGLCFLQAYILSVLERVSIFLLLAIHNQGLRLLNHENGGKSSSWIQIPSNRWRADYVLSNTQGFWYQFHFQSYCWCWSQ